uniref:Uncharacterized protein n=1 Tax=Panagrolaimus davidi TaxID=227884 RepID=A0A914PL86_9BILA
MISENTVKELSIIPHFSKICEIVLHEIRETFDIETCFAFIKKNKYTRFAIDFHYDISEAYKIRVETVIDEIVQTENHDYKVPYIYFSELDHKKEKKLRTLYDKN